VKFFDYLDFYTFLKNNSGYKKADFLSVEDFYRGLTRSAEAQNDVFVFRQSKMELSWINAKKPYYNIYPVIFPMVKNLNLDVPCNMVQCPLDVLCLKLPELPNNPFVFNGQPVRTVMFQHQEVAREKGSNQVIRGIVISIDCGERERTSGCPIQVFKIFPLREDMTIDQACNSLPSHHTLYMGMKVDDEMVNQVVKLCCTVCLIGNDPELVCPDVIAKEREKFEAGDEETKKKIIEKSIRRGKYGFNLGANLEMIPHYRRPHLALVWTGKGKTIAKVVMRKGSVVHREKIVEVPSGYKGS
jgi:hypothetical protein